MMSSGGALLAEDDLGVEAEGVDLWTLETLTTSHPRKGRSLAEYLSPQRSSIDMEHGDAALNSAANQ